MRDLEEFSNDPEGLLSCDCKDPCVDSEYTAQISSYNFPSENFVKQQDIDDGEYGSFTISCDAFMHVGVPEILG